MKRNFPGAPIMKDEIQQLKLDEIRQSNRPIQYISETFRNKWNLEVWCNGYDYSNAYD